MTIVVTEEKGKMEIVTTVEEFPKEIQKHHLKPDIKIRVIVEESLQTLTQTVKKTSRRFSFLDTAAWKGNEKSPTDISTNVDHYLYDLEDPHGGH